MIDGLSKSEVFFVLWFGLLCMAAAPLLLLYDLNRGTYRRWV